MRRANPRKLLRTVILAALVLGAAMILPHRLAWHLNGRRLVVPSSVSLPKAALPFVTEAGSAQVEVAGGPVLYAHNPNIERPIASTTKIMTAYLVLHTPSMPLQRVVTITPVEVDNDRRGVLKADSEVPLAVGQRVTVNDLLWALMLPSADDSAWVLARTVSGNPNTFVSLMNRTAQKLDMRRTHYVDPDGVNHAGYSTARDLLKLTAVAMQDPEFRHLVGTAQHTTTSFGTLVNLNQLLGNYPGAIGVKTGWTPWAGSCLVFADQRKLYHRSITLYGVVLGEPSFNPMFSDVKRLLNTAFSLPYHTVVKAKSVVARQTIGGFGAPKVLTFSVKSSLGAFATGGHADIQWQWLSKTSWTKGEVVGMCRVTQTGWKNAGPWVPILADQNYKVPWWGSF
ncbi:MAG: D-alanyl-D-alanine carboxypeptidase [Sulfobacillus benefaciens]|uniref:D-alanyl-D-alanine carboxypeptidase n=1 Tax=Sulfobacillus benefaciens TaxID=453960 RepID=A0A2T2XIJ6_9FIRM|nr:MAG: D-alanyl-D-alanine carboxypeptidase [Sulfobacillus benefaciens]